MLARTGSSLALCTATWLGGMGLAYADAGPAIDAQSKEGHALALGVTLGHPIRGSLKYQPASLPVAAEVGVGSGVLGGTGLHIDANLSFEHDLGPVGLSVGAGYRRYEHNYDPGSIDELDSDLHHGVQGLVALRKRLGNVPVEIFAEFIPGYDLSQSESCSFMSGVNTLCPHQEDSRNYYNMGVGARYWINL